MCIYIYIYTCIYVERERGREGGRERERERERDFQGVRVKHQRMLCADWREQHASSDMIHEMMFAIKPVNTFSMFADKHIQPVASSTFVLPS